MSGDVNEQNKAEQKSGGFEKYLIALVIVCLAAGIAYQMFFCSTCYGLTQKYVPAAARTAPQ